jgi:serine phosphatase RsbU (regulator of sigma subunit)
VVTPITNGVLAAVVDGVGHGSEAAKAARAAIETLEAYAEEPVVSLMRRCHQRMRATRGAAISLAALNDRDHTLCWLSVGNVEGLLLRGENQEGRADERVVLRGGVVGFNLPQLQTVVLPVWPGDTLIFATDGIHADFANELSRTIEPQELANQICSKYCKQNDDALVLAVRYTGKPR